MAEELTSFVCTVCGWVEVDTQSFLRTMFAQFGLDVRLVEE